MALTDEVFVTGGEMKYLQHMREDWLDTTTIARFCNTTRRTTLDNLHRLHDKGLIQCKVDLNFPRAQRLWRLKPETLSK